MERQRNDSLEGSDSLAWDHFQIHPTSSFPLRRPLGGSSEVRKDIVAENNRQCSTDVRRADDVFGPSRSRPELAADRGSQRRPKRRGRSNPWALAHANAASDRRPRQQGWLLELVSEALVTSGTSGGGVSWRTCSPGGNGPRPPAISQWARMVHDDNMPPQKWIIGRISEVEGGADGRDRVDVVKTP